jgi:hypothetical protein
MTTIRPIKKMKIKWNDDDDDYLKKKEVKHGKWFLNRPATLLLLSILAHEIT